MMYLDERLERPRFVNVILLLLLSFTLFIYLTIYQSTNSFIDTLFHLSAQLYLKMFSLFMNLFIHLFSFSLFVHIFKSLFV